MRIPATALLTLLLAAPLLSLADAREDALFGATDQVREQAEAAEAALLAPGSYGQGIAALDQAHRDFQGGADTGAVEKLLDQAGESFSQATRNATAATRSFAAPLARRESARKADAVRLAASTWVKSEGLLTNAAQRLEKGDGEGALKRAEEAGALYDAAELQAIKATLLTEARSRVVELGPAGTSKFAPKTTARAEALLQQAEAELDADRTRTDAAGLLAAQASTEARHALALAVFLRAAREGDATPEDLVLEWETGLMRAAAAASNTADLSGGPREATNAMVTTIAGLHQRADQQAAELQQRDRQIAALEEEIRELDSRLAGASSEARSLTERLESRERARQQFEQIERVFPTDQAVVFRQGDSIIVRVQGLAFASGSANLPAGASPMLEKLREVTTVYPRAMYVVEGHTDSTGDSAANQHLSQARADAVRSYLVERLQVPAGRVSAVGYGDSRPIAKNESSEDRRQNRRIDLVITPREQIAP
jgi:outer membrane protein OmpA-like peptidoglycan-associated protein